MANVNALANLPSSATLREFVERRTEKLANPDFRPQDDRIEISELGRFMSRLSELPDVRVEKVARVRASILRGDYETPEKIDKAIEKLVATL